MCQLSLLNLNLLIQNNGNYDKIGNTSSVACVVLPACLLLAEYTLANSETLQKRVTVTVLLPCAV